MVIDSNVEGLILQALELDFVVEVVDGETITSDHQLIENILHSIYHNFKLLIHISFWKIWIY